MYTEQLRRCIKLISYTHSHYEKSVVEIILNEQTNLETDYINPFITELDENLMNEETNEGELNVIRTYLKKLKFMNDFFCNYHEYRLFTGKLELVQLCTKKYRHTSEEGETEELDEFDNYIVNGWQLFDELITEIQFYCERYEIDFLKACEEMEFSTEHIDCNVTNCYLSEKSLNHTKTDTRYFLNTFHSKTEQSRIDYKNFEWIIKEGGRLPFKKDGISVYFYNPQIAYILNKEDLIVQNLETHENTTINGNTYTQTYVNAYIEGTRYFDSEYKVSPSTLYGNKADTYVNDLKEKYFHSKIKAIHSGWWYVKNTTFILLTHEVIKDYGFYSGLVSKVEEQASKYPKLFENFFVNEHELINRNPNADEPQPYGYTKVEKLEISPEGEKSINLPPQQTENNTNKLRVKQIALIHIYEGKQITREIAEKVAAQHGYTSRCSGEGLFQDYTTFSSLANRKGRPTLCTPKKLKNKIELFESILPHLSDNNKQKAIDEINILKTILDSDYQ